VMGCTIVRFSEERLSDMTQCRALGCLKEASTFGAYCSTHSSRRRKNGHEHQRNIRAVELTPFLNLVQARRLRNLENPVWPALGARWQGLVAEAQGILAVYEGGKPTLDHMRAAAEEIIRLDQTTLATTIMDMALAMTMYWQLVPRVFLSDDAFKVQLVRRVVRVSPSNALVYDGPGRHKRAYREFSPRVMDVLSTWLLSAFGAAAMKLADLEARDRAEADRISTELNKGLEDLN
jgi:hypothetical protein